MDSSQAPLISNAQHQHLDEEELDYDVEAESPVVEAGKAADAGPSTFVLVLTFAAGISGLLFGCRNCLFPRESRR
jgi:SP family myo-inositol transporter-like MFS transporter 13